jgi:hypothetical protein
VGKFSSKIVLGGREIDVINVDEMRRNWIASINELVDKLGIVEEEAIPEIITVPQHGLSLSLDSQHDIKVYMSVQLRSIVDSLERDTRPANFLRHNGMLKPDSVGVSIGVDGKAVISDPDGVISNPEYRRQQINQYRIEIYTGEVEVEPNPKSLSTVLFIASLLDESIEVTNPLLPYKAATGIARVIRNAGAMKQLAGVYRDGEVSPADLWYNALYSYAERLSLGNSPLLVEDTLEQAQLDVLIRRKMQEEFARAAASNLGLAVGQMFYALPLGNFISPHLNSPFLDYHRLVLPNSVFLGSFFEGELYLGKDHERHPLTPELIDAREFMLNILSLEHTFYPPLEVSTRYIGDVKAGSGLNFSRSNTANMSQVIAMLSLCAGHLHGHVNTIRDICDNWLLQGRLPNSFSTRVQNEFDMGVDEATVLSGLLDLETAVSSFY